MSNNKVKKIFSYLRHYGPGELIKKYMENKAYGDNYNNSRLKELPTEDELRLQKEHTFEYEPMVSIIIPAYNSPKEAFLVTLNTVKAQTYTNWELCINDAGDFSIKDVVDSVFGKDDRVKYNRSNVRLGISDNSNEALKLATGDYVGFLDHDDLLTEDALFHMVDNINKTSAIMVYSDEDKVSEDFKTFFRPYRKPDYNPTLFLSNNYICHFCLIKRELVMKLGGFRSEYDGAQDYDLFLRCSEKTDNIQHVCRILYHWRVTSKSTSDNPFNKNYAGNAGKKALEAYLLRNGLKKAKVYETKDPGYFRMEYTGDVDMELYEWIGGPDMKIEETSLEYLYKRAMLTGADVIVPKTISQGKYVYNGLAKRGDSTTKSLVGCPKWYRGRFNHGITAMDVCVVPNSGILVKKEHLHRFTQEKVDYTGLRMVYEPEALLEIKR